MKIFRELNDDFLGNDNFERLSPGEICIVARDCGYNRNTFELVRRTQGGGVIRWNERFSNLRKAVTKLRIINERP